MNIWHGLDEIPENLTASVVTIGVFDGIHSGHQQLIRTATTMAAKRGLPAVMMTFAPHPLAVICPERMPPLLGNVDDRALIARSLGIDGIVAMRFDPDIAHQSPEEFFVTILCERLGARAIVVGENFTFGHKAAGTTDTLRELGARYGVDIVVVPLVNTHGEPVSSTRIRRLLSEGDVRAAGDALTRPFAVRGIVERGAGRGGRELGFPTANLYFSPRQALPKDGVYAGYFTVLDSRPIPGDMDVEVRYPAAISIGTNPTFGDERRAVEAFVVDHDADLYGHHVRVEFVEFVRGMYAFGSVDELLNAMRGDVTRTREIVPNELPMLP